MASWEYLGSIGHLTVSTAIRLDNGKIMIADVEAERTEDPWVYYVSFFTITSSDNARSWQDGGVIEEWFIGYGHPMPHVDAIYRTPAGTIYLCLEWEGDTTYYISTNDGVTFSPWLGTLADRCVGPYIDLPVGGYLVYKGSNIYYSADGETVSLRSSPLPGTNIRGLVVLSDGTVVVTFASNTGKIASARSSDSGLSWTLGGVLSGTATGIGKAVAGHHDIVIATASSSSDGAWAAYSLDAGDTWSFARLRRYSHFSYDIMVLPSGYTAISVYSTGEIFVSLTGSSWVLDGTIGATSPFFLDSTEDGEVLVHHYSVSWWAKTFAPPPPLPAVVAPPEITTTAEGFGYTAWVSWVRDSTGTRDVILRFAKKPADEWVTIEVDDLSEDGAGYWYSYAQNYGSTFLVTCSKWRQEGCYVYKSTDNGDTWEELTNNLASGVRWLDCWQGTWVAFLEDEDIARTTDGITWTIVSAPLPEDVADGISEFAASEACLGEDGVIHVAASDSYGVYYSKSADLGDTWSDPVYLLDTDAHADLDASSLYMGGIGAYDGRVCIGGAFYTYHYDPDGSSWGAIAVAQVSLDNGDSWGTFLYQEIPFPPYYDEFNLYYAAGFWMDSAKACIAVSGHLYNTGGVPYPYIEAYQRETVYLCHVVLDPAEGGPRIENNNYLTEIEGATEGTLTGTMCYGQEKGMGGAFCMRVPVKSYPEPCTTAAPCREAPYDAHAFLRELRAYFLDDDGNFVHETVWTGDYSGPHLLFPYQGATWDDNNYDAELDISLRFSAWRSGGAAAYGFWW